MTIPYERTRAVLSTEKFLRDLAFGEVKRIPKAVRDQAKALLRHYPTAFDLVTVTRGYTGDKALSQCPFAHPDEDFFGNVKKNEIAAPQKQE